MSSALELALLAAVRRSWQLRQRLVFDTKIDLGNGRQCIVPIVQGFGLHHFDFAGRDPWAAPLFDDLLKREQGGFVDVGANIGSMIVNLMAGTWPQTYTAFDPNATCCAYVERMLHANRLQGAVYACALGDAFGTARLQFSDPMDVSATMIEGFRPKTMYENRKSAIVARGDDVLADRKEPVRILKIDAEGAEINVLRGFNALLGHDRPIVVLEISPYRSFENGTYDRRYFGEIGDAERLEIAAFRREQITLLDQFFGERHYRACRQIDGKWTPVGSFDPPDPHTENDLNWLAVPQERVAEIERMPARA